MVKDTIQKDILKAIEDYSSRFNWFKVYDDNILCIKIFSRQYEDNFILLKSKTDTLELHLYKDNTLLYIDTFKLQDINAFITLLDDILNGSIMFITDTSLSFGSTTQMVKVNKQDLNETNLALSFISNPNNASTFIWC